MKLAVPPVALCVVTVFAFCVGQYPIPIRELFMALGNQLGLSIAVPADVNTVLWEIRLPRILAGIIVGASLSIAGAAYQGMFRNPLVSPDILGVSSGAGLGAVIAIFFGFPMTGVQLMAFSGGIISVCFVYLVGKLAKFHSPVLALVLSGIAIGALFGSGISLFKILSDPYSQLSTITFWLMGGLNSVVMRDVFHTFPVIVAGMIPLVLLRWRMNILSLDDEEAESLGVNIRQTRIIFIVSATLMSAAVVSITGIIGWVGLVIPHISRLWIGSNFSRLLPTSLFIGAAFLVLTDTLARTIAPIELPIGILTSFIGAPFFVFLLIRGGERK